MSPRFAGPEESGAKLKFVDRPELDRHEARFSFKHFLVDHKDHGVESIKNHRMYHRFVERLKHMSGTTWGNLKREKGMHLVPRDRVMPFNALPRGLAAAQEPWQFKVDGKFRVYGFFDRERCHFEVVYFDPEHRTYPFN